MGAGRAVVGLVCLFAPQVALAQASNATAVLLEAGRAAPTVAQRGSTARFRVSIGAAFGSTRDADAQLSGSGLGLLARADARLGTGWLGLEYGVHHLTGADPRWPGDVPVGGLEVVPLRTDHLLVSYELPIGTHLFVRPALGFARHRFFVGEPRDGGFVPRRSSEVGLAVGAAVGARLARWDTMDLRVEGFWRHSAGEDSTGSRRLLAVQLVLAVPIG